MPIISGLSYTVTDSTIVATWTTDVSADSNLSAGGKPAIDNGVAAASTAHQAIVVGLLPNKTYSCFVTSGGSSSTPQNVTTNVAQTRILVTAASNGAVTLGSNSNNKSDTHRTFLSSDNKVYVTQDDGYGIVLGTPNAGYATQVAALSNEVNMTGGAALITAYGAYASTDGTDGPLADAMTNKNTGLFGLNANLHMFLYRQYPPTYTTNRYANWIKSTNHGSTWNNFTALSTFVSGGNPVLPHSPSEPVQFYSNLIGLVTPVLYAADDGTLGYNTAGNQIDGANAYVYMTYYFDANGTNMYLMRIPRIQFDAQNAAAIQYWAAAGVPTAAKFVNDGSWSNSPASAVNIKPAAGSALHDTGLWHQVAFIPAMNSYMMVQSASYNGDLITNSSNWLTYSGPTPAGPWTLVFNQPNSDSENLKQWYGFFPFHRDVAGNSATHDVAIKALYAGDFTGAQTNYNINYSTQTLNPTSGAAMVQQAFYGFTTVENPLSNGGTFGTSPGRPNLKVAASGKLQCVNNNDSTTQNFIGLTFPLDHYVEILVGAAATGDNLYGGVRGSNTVNTNYLMSINAQAGANGFLSLYAIVNGVNLATLINAVTTSGMFPGDVFRLSVTGNVLTVSKNQNVIQTFTDTNNYVPGPGVPQVGMNAAVIANTWISAFAAGFNIFAITGNAGAPGVTVTYSGASSGSVVSDSLGNFTVYGVGNGGYTITPSLAGLAFAPASRPATVASANVSGLNFTASPSGGDLGPGYDLLFKM